jgi:hypothetical protein
MVSLTDRNALFRETDKDPQLRDFASFVFDRKIHSKFDESKLRNADEIPSLCLVSILSNNKNQFNKCLLAITNRKPKSTSPWIYNDLLIFILLLGIRKFREDNTSLIQIIKLRQSAQDEERTRLTETFLNLATNSFEIDNKFGFVCIAFQSLLDSIELDEKQINTTYAHMTATNFYSELSLFAQILAIKTLDDLFARKELKDPKLHIEQNQFVDLFVYRSEIVGKVCYYGILALVVSITLYLNYIRIYQSSEQKELIELIKDVYSLLGFGGLIGYFLLRRQIISGIQKLVFHIFGFRGKKLLQAHK